MFIRMGEGLDGTDLETASEFVCRLYGQSKTNDVDEARHKKLIEMTGKVNQVIENKLKSYIKILFLLSILKDFSATCTQEVGWYNLQSMFH